MRGLPQPERRSIFQRDGWRCYLCHTEVVAWIGEGTPPKNAATIDHVEPRMAGGVSTRENMRTACWECNHQKGARSVAEFRSGVRPKMAGVDEALRASQPGIDHRQPLRASIGELLRARKDEAPA